MTINEARDKLRSIVADYFGDGHVFFADTKRARKPEPYITVKFISRGRQFFATEIVDDDEYLKSFREINARAEINLFTKGRDVSNNKGTPVYENTAMEDLEAFLDYLESDEIIEECERQNMTILPYGDVRDLSVLQNESQYQYRALLECEVRFTDIAFGGYGLDGRDPGKIPDGSDGGTNDLITGPRVINEAEIGGEYE